MPKCKNDPSRRYKGNEPSPKGLGFCAHSEPIGSTRHGKNGKRWKVKQVKGGTKRWVPFKVKEDATHSTDPNYITTECNPKTLYV